jgi:hypothetical protein
MMTKEEKMDEIFNALTHDIDYLTDNWPESWKEEFVNRVSGWLNYDYLRNRHLNGEIRSLPGKIEGWNING